jgi:hypothetical protein
MTDVDGGMAVVEVLRAFGVTQFFNVPGPGCGPNGKAWMASDCRCCESGRILVSEGLTRSGSGRRLG